MLNIFFLAPHSYSLFYPQDPKIFGGSEVRAWLLAREIAKDCKFKVSFLLMDHGQKEVDTKENVTLYRDSSWNSRGPSVFRQNSLLKYPTMPFRIGWELSYKALRWFGNSKFMLPFRSPPPVFEQQRELLDRVMPDWTCLFGVNTFGAGVISYSKKARLKTALLLGSDSDLSERNTRCSSYRNPYGSLAHWCHFTVIHADLVIAQSQKQKALLKERFDRDCVVIGNPVEVDQLTSLKESITTLRGYVLWIGKADSVKRPDLCIEVARQCPDMNFLMLMNPSHESMRRLVLRAKPRNVQVVEQLSYSEAECLFSEALVFLNTSEYEGFPNTFLQAGKYGVPVVSLKVDPDDMLVKNNAGVNAQGVVSAAIKALKELHQCKDRRAELSENIRRYVVTHHRLKDKARELMNALAES